MRFSREHIQKYRILNVKFNFRHPDGLGNDKHRTTPNTKEQRASVKKSVEFNVKIALLRGFKFSRNPQFFSHFLSTHFTVDLLALSF
jgi:hypothetical protein